MIHLIYIIVIIVCIFISFGLTFYFTKSICDKELDLLHEARQLLKNPMLPNKVRLEVEGFISSLLDELTKQKK